jgi:hypothetical protein
MAVPCLTLSLGERPNEPLENEAHAPRAEAESEPHCAIPILLAPILHPSLCPPDQEGTNGRAPHLSDYRMVLANRKFQQDTGGRSLIPQ